MIIISRPLIKKIDKLYNIKTKLKNEINVLESKKTAFLKFMSNNKENIEIIQQLGNKKKKLNIERINIVDRMQRNIIISLHFL